MSNETDKMNYCCDCGWAVKKGLFFKRWYCTNPEKNDGFGSHIFHPVTCMPVIKTPIDCDTARFVGKGLLVEQYAVNLKHPCPNYKGQLRGHPAIPPMKNHLPCPPRPVESKNAEIFSEFLMGGSENKRGERSKRKDDLPETENKALKEERGVSFQSQRFLWKL